MGQKRKSWTVPSDYSESSQLAKVEARGHFVDVRFAKEAVYFDDGANPGGALVYLTAREAKRLAKRLRKAHRLYAESLAIGDSHQQARQPWEVLREAASVFQSADPEWHIFAEDCAELAAELEAEHRAGEG